MPFDDGTPHAGDVLPLAQLLWVQADNVLGLQATVKEQVRHALFACAGQHPTDAFPGRMSVLVVLLSASAVRLIVLKWSSIALLIALDSSSLRSMRILVIHVWYKGQQKTVGLQVTACAHG